MSLTIGSRLGAFEITGSLGAGGMGEVYRARDTRLNRDVALKILPEVFATDLERLARFEREAQVLASLNHPHIAQIYGIVDAGSADAAAAPDPASASVGRVPRSGPAAHALVMEFVDGETLADRIARGPMPVDEALPLARQMADALDAAHEQGIIHRDLKPANIKVRRDGTVKVLDFGLAKLVAPPEGGHYIPAAGSPDRSVRLQPDLAASPTITSPALMTGVGMLLGTAAYMSPEQAKGREADRRSDIWAFGCVLFEMLTGKRAFVGDDVADTMAAVLKSEPDWAAVSDDVPPPIRELIRRCLSKDLRQRVADVSVISYVLSENGSAFAAPPSRAGALPLARVARRPATYAAAALLGMLITAAAAWMAWPRAAAPPIFRFTLPLGDEPVSIAGRQLAAISPDGTRVVYAAADRLLIRSLSEFDWHEVAGTRSVAPSTPVFSPDGSAVAFYAEGALKRIDVTGGTAVAVCAAESPSGMVWDASGLIFAQQGNIAGRRGIYRCPGSGGAPEMVVDTSPDEQPHGPQLLPGGDTLLFTVAKAGDGPARWDRAQIVTYSRRSKQRRVLIDGGSDARYVDTGHVLYAIGGVLMAVPFDLQTQTVSGPSVAVLQGVARARANTTGTAQFYTSNTGTLLYVPGPAANVATTYEIAFANRSGATLPLSLRGPYAQVRASRDGTRIALGSDDGREANVWIYDLSGTTTVRRLTLDGRNRFPIWSPDGQRVAYQSDREGDLGLFAQRADGTGAVERLTRATAGESHIPESWSPDGSSLLFSVTRDGLHELRQLALEAKQIKPFGNIRSVEPIEATFSPDGRWVAYGVNPGGDTIASTNFGVFIQPFPATGDRYQIPKVRRDYHPVWSRDGSQLYFVPSANSGQMAVVAITTSPAVAFGPPELFPARVTADRISNERRAHDLLPDGRFIGPALDAGSSGVETRRELRIVMNWFDELRSRAPRR